MSADFLQGRLELAELADINHPVYEAKQSIDERFAVFHELNPHVFDELSRIALDLVGRGHERIGVGMLFEVLRWSAMSTRSTGDEFKLNNSYRSRYARLLAAGDARLADVFEFRTLTSLAVAS